MREPQSAGWLRVDSGRTLSLLRTLRRPMAGAGAALCGSVGSGPEEAKLGRPAALSNSAWPARFGSSPRPHNPPVPKGQQCSVAEGPLHKGQGREDGPSQGAWRD